MIFYDNVPLAGTRMTKDGYLVASAKVARTGIQLYRGYEVGKPEMDVVRVYRPEDEVFSRDAMHSFAWKPVTINHPKEPVTADNISEVGVGQIGDEVVRDGDAIRVPLVLMDASAIKTVSGGKRELSMGYSCALDWTSGMTQDGQEYDAVQRDIRANHLAVVDAARAGPDFRLGDKKSITTQSKEVPMTEKTLRTVVVDGIPVETTDAAAAVIEKLQKQLADAMSEKEKLDKEKEEEDAKKDAEIAKKDAQIEELQGKVLGDEALDALVSERVDVVAKATRIMGDGFEVAGKSNTAIVKEVVLAKMGDGFADKSDAYLQARFDVLAEQKGSDPIRAKMGDGKPAAHNVGDAAQVARQEYMNNLSNAWKGAN